MKKIKFASIIVTYKCNSKCCMCYVWKRKETIKMEIKSDIYQKLPQIDTINITGGEPFLHNNLEEIIQILEKKSKRIVISTNGFYKDKIIYLLKKYNKIGVRISIEGINATNDITRGIEGGFEKAISSIHALKKLGLKDLGIGMTINDYNYKDLLEMYQLSESLDVEFTTAAVHNSFYFNKFDNRIDCGELIINIINKLIRRQLSSFRIKDWFRAYFNYGLIKYIQGEARILPCEMGHDSFFLDPYGEIYPCNVMEKSMGNIADNSFSAIWNSNHSKFVKSEVKHCKKNCWMIGSVSQQIKKYPLKPSLWIFKNKLFRFI